MCALGCSGSTAAEPSSHTLLAIMTTLCSTNRDDFLIYNHKTLKIGMWQNMTNVAKHFWCLPDIAVDRTKMQFELMKYFDRYQLVYQTDRLIMRDTHYPSDFSEKRLASKDQVEKSRKIWTIVKGPRVAIPTQSSNSTNKNSSMILQNDASNISELLSRNSRNKSNRAELIKQLKEKAAAEEKRKKLVYQVRAKSSAETLEKKIASLAAKKSIERQKGRNTKVVVGESNQFNSQINNNNSEMHRSNHVLFEDSFIRNDVSKSNSNNKKSIQDFNETVATLHQSRILNDELAHNEFLREKMRKEDESRRDAENFNEQIRRQTLLRSNLRHQNALDQELELSTIERLQDRGFTLSVKERDKVSELEKSKRLLEHDLEKSSRTWLEASTNSDHLRAMEIKSKDQQHELSLLQHRQSHIVKVISTRQNPTLNNMQLSNYSSGYVGEESSSSKKRDHYDLMSTEELNALNEKLSKR
jgi:hypothetical protein